MQILRSSTSKSAPTPQVFNDFDFQIALARRRGANFAKLNFQFLAISTSESLSRAGVVQILRSSTSKSAPTPPVFNDFDFRIDLARRRGAHFAKLHFQFLAISASESLSRAGVVQILRSSTSKSAPTPQVFNDFDFQITLARRRGANFAKLNFQFLAISTSESLSRVGVVQILRSSTSKSAPTPPVFNDFDVRIDLARRRGANFCDILILGNRSFATPVFGTCFCEPSKPPNYGKTQQLSRNSYPPKSLMSRICACRQLSV